jgi:chloramphenicol-sensitive protein RarD
MRNAPAASSAPGVAPPARGSVASRDSRVGVLYGIGAYGLWGLFPLYFRAIKTVPALEVLAHRVLWSLVLLLLILVLRRSFQPVRVALRSRKTLGILSITTLLIAGNWLMYIWATTHQHVLDASLGYFINPLFSILLGYVFLHERLRPMQTLSVALAGLAVGYLTVAAGSFPFIALFLAATFGLYGLLRKLAPVDALAGLTIETGLLGPLAGAWLAWNLSRGTAVFGGPDASINVLLLLAGVVTAVPLLWFTAAAKRLRLSTLGFLQYLAPTGQFLCGVIAMGERLSPTRLVAFAVIWLALVLYSIDTARALPGRMPVPAPD